MAVAAIAGAGTQSVDRGVDSEPTSHAGLCVAVLSALSLLLLLVVR
jgi:hypothetical protein